MGDIVQFPRLRVVQDNNDGHELSLQWCEAKSKVKAVCACGVEFGRWRPEEKTPKENLAPARRAFRRHMADVRTEANNG
jgi:hypothetical protein